MPISISKVFKQKNGNICSFEFGEHMHTEREKINTINLTISHIRRRSMPISISRVFKLKNGNICYLNLVNMSVYREKKLAKKKSNNFSYQEAVDANFHQQSL